MSWNILPKNVLQYFLTKLKGLMYTKTEVDNLIPDSLSDLSDDATHRLVTDTEKTVWSGKSVVSANPQSTTGTLSGLEIDGVGYAVQGGDVSGKYDKITQSGVGSCICDGQSEYFKIATLTITETNINGPIGFEVSQTFNQVTLLQIGFAKTDNTDPDVAWFYTNQRNNYWIVKENTSVWGLYGQFENTVDGCSLHRIVGYRVNNGVTVTVNLTNVSALPSGATQPTYGGSVNYANIANRAVSATDSTKVAKAGDSMSGPLLVNATGGVGSYDEGIRINAGKNGYATLCIGGGANSTSGTAEGQFWIGTNPTNNSYKRKLYIAQNGSTGSGTYFESDSASRVGPALHLGWSGSVTSGNSYAVTGGNVYDAIAAALFKVTRGSSVDLGTTGYWAAMCNSGGPSNKWWHILSMDWSGNDNKNWISQLAIATQDGNGVWWRRNNAGGTAITSSTWHRLAEGDANGSASSCNGYTLGKSVPSNAVFTDTNNAVTQNDNNGNNWNLRLLLSGSQDDTTRTQGCYKTRNLQYNDYWKALYIGDANRGWGMIYSQGSQQLNISASAEEKYRLFLGVRESTWALAPLYNQYLKLGTGSFKWNQIYSSSATINTSDRRKKKDIQPLDENARIFVMKLNPVSYKLKDGETGRTHYGMIAQDIEDELTELGMTAMDFAGFCKDEVYENVKTTKEGFTEVKTIKKPGEYIYGLRYEEFIAPLIKTVQLQQQEIEELKHRIDILEGK